MLSICIEPPTQEPSRTTWAGTFGTAIRQHYGECSEIWEVLNRVRVDGVGGISFFFFVFLRFEQGQTSGIECANGEFHSDPVCTDPVQNFSRKACNHGNKAGMTGALREISPRAAKPKATVYSQKTPQKRFRYPALRSKP